jgi:uncharacterized membrane protein YgdD (TMEM256/DUF423 family)
LKQFILLFASLNGLLSIILGAFGAHFLKSKIPLDKLSGFETGVKYQMFHVLVLLFISSIFDFNSGLQKNSAIFFMVGLVLFSYSIYFLSIQNLLNANLKFLGPITPIGGLLLILGWFFLFLNFATTKN